MTRLEGGGVPDVFVKRHKAAILPMETQLKYTMVKTPQGLRETCAALAQASTLALDLEADTMFHYGETPCLAQLSEGDRIWLVDLLLVRDLSTLKPVLEGDSVEKVLHGSDYDIRLLRRHFGLDCRPRFDTEIAGRFLGMRQTGLSEVLGKYFNVRIDKKFQKQDWTQRPLPEDMCRYAAADVYWLVRLAALMKNELAALGRLAWVEEECTLLGASKDRSVKSGPLFLRFKGADRLDRRDLAVLEEILQARESLASRRDRPPFKVLSPDTIRNIVRERPTTDRELLLIKGLGRRIGELRAPVLAAVQRALELPGERLPEYPKAVRRRPKYSPRFQVRVQALKEWRDRRAADLGLEAGLVCANRVIYELAGQEPVAPEDLGRVRLLRRWQQEEFGEEICRVIKGNR